MTLPFTLPGRQDWLFSIRTFGAAMAALWLGMWLDLPRPYWAMATVYIATQPFAGATRSKAAFRAVGTVLGGLAALVMVPPLVNEPMLLSVALAGWVGGCLFLALLDRTPRGYAFMLAGYSAAIIGFPSVDTPGAIFDTVLARVEEILLGIGCAALAATIVLPRAAGPALGARVAAWLAEADAWALDALAGRAEDEAYVARRRHLAVGIGEVEALAGSLAWDDGAGPGVARAMWALRQTMLMLLPILSSVDDRVAGIAGADDGAGERLRAAPAIAAVRTWLRTGESADKAIDVLEQAVAGRRDWPGLVLESLGLRLRAFVSLRGACDRLRRQVAGQEPASGTGASFVHHRDAGMAALSAVAAAIAVLLCCAFWIGTAWPDGAVAAEMAAVVCSFFAQQDNPVPAILSFLKWSVVAVVIDTIILFGLLPQATSFEMVVLVLAPIFLVYGLLIARPATTLIGVALGANGATLLGLQTSYGGDFGSFVNSGLALLIGMAAGAAVTALLRSVGAAWSIRRLQRANWSAFADAARGWGSDDRERYAALLLDRVSLMAARLSAAEPGSDVHRLRPLSDIRIGLNVLELRRGRRGLPDAARQAVELALDALAAHFAERARGATGGPGAALLEALDRALDAVGGLAASEAQRNALQGLVGVHRGLCPNRRPDVVAPAAVVAA